MLITQRPELFVDLSHLIEDLQIDLKYFTGDNFLAEKVDGYCCEVALLTKPAAEALKRVQKQLKQNGLALKIFDCYRPQRAVEHFVRWTGEKRIDNQQRFFPELTPQELFDKGYLLQHSSHSRGSTVDLTIIDLKNGAELDMGTEFDFFGEQSWIDYPHPSAQVRANRMLLRQVMQQHGFVPFHQEWWHFTLADEPYPDSYFDFPVE